MKAWHFLNDNGLLRDGNEPPENEEWLVFEDKPIMCEQGLHASIKPLDALKYAPGSIICRVEISGEIIKGDVKLVATKRKILWRYDASNILRRFACLCALDVIHLWNPPTIVLKYLRTQSEETRAAARDAARDAAGDAALIKQNNRLYRMLVRNRP